MKSILILLPAAIHVYIFIMESFLWGKARTNRTFGITAEEAKTTKSLAFNQGFYNLFLALAIVVGWGLNTFSVLAAAGPTAGTVLAGFGLCAIILAGLVLLLSAPRLFRSALFQIVPAAAGLLALLL
jgi:putative membrane protein